MGVQHYRISRMDNRWYYISPRLTFQCLEDMINHYSGSDLGHIPTPPATPPPPTTVPSYTDTNAKNNHSHLGRNIAVVDGGILLTSSHPGAVPQSGQPPGLPLRSSNPRTAPPMAAPPGPLRRSESVGRRPLLRHPHPHHPPLFPQRDSDYELEPERGRKRAIDNQYMFRFAWTLLPCHEPIAITTVTHHDRRTWHSQSPQRQATLASWAENHGPHR
ncbi:hypothetical protein CRUP_021622 [Coryphaenoides rupestris]|nr:hypothetical protein CRUP_021622 [Coryphaenoides rupestris]